MNIKIVQRLLVAALGILVLLAISLELQFTFPNPTGPFPVSRISRIWVDQARPEANTSNPDDFRNVPVVIWYPADTAASTTSPYFPGLAQVAKSLSTSGEVSPWEVFGLRFIRIHETRAAPIARNAGPYPVVIFSPGNGTNVEFYAGITDELASYGYIVVGINHPYDVAATALQDGTIAQYKPAPSAPQLAQSWITLRVQIRTEDVLFAIQQIEDMNTGNDPIFAKHIDLAHIAVMGHSLGGITAAQACRASALLSACLNLDGIQQGGPFSTLASAAAPEQPFMMITKETRLSSKFLGFFENKPSESYLVVIPSATHNNFTDGPLLTPALLPFPGKADQILSLEREYTLAFLNQTLKHDTDPLLAKSYNNQLVRFSTYP
jgi:dienelactone hydrolase